MVSRAEITTSYAEAYVKASKKDRGRILNEVVAGQRPASTTLDTIGAISYAQFHPDEVSSGIPRRCSEHNRGASDGEGCRIRSKQSLEVCHQPNSEDRASG